MDLTDVQAILELKLLFGAFMCWQEYSSDRLCFLPALCIIITLVYFFPKKVRRSVLSSLNSLSHSPEQTAEQRGQSHFEYRMPDTETLQKLLND